MNATFDQKYDQQFLDKAKAYYINASTAYTPILCLICAISALPSLLLHGSTSQQLVPLICVVACGLITFILQRTRADQLFKNVESPNDNVTCTVNLAEDHINYTLHTPINDLRQYHFDLPDLKEVMIGRSQGCLVLDDITILPFGVNKPEGKEAEKEQSKLFKIIKKKAPMNTMTTLYNLFRIVLVIFTIANIMAIFV